MGGVTSPDPEAVAESGSTTPFTPPFLYEKAYWFTTQGTPKERGDHRITPCRKRSREALRDSLVHESGARGRIEVPFNLTASSLA